jgi:hypothetical protein
LVGYNVRCSRPIASAVSWFKYRPVRAITRKACKSKLFDGAAVALAELLGINWGSISFEGVSHAGMRVRNMPPVRAISSEAFGPEPDRAGRRFKSCLADY